MMTFCSHILGYSFKPFVKKTNALILTAAIILAPKSSHNLFSATAYFRPPKTLPYKNLDTLNFAAVEVSLFSAGTALLGGVFLLAV